jgi:hypothetical protein
MGGSGANLMPMKTTEVSMVSEDITLQGGWSVDARYEFRNNTDKALALQLGFPEYRCDPGDGGDCVDPASYAFEQMKTEVRGKPVPIRKGKVSREHRMGEWLGRAWLFDVNFAPRETVAVRHTYYVPGATVVDGTESIVYITRTGALWAGPIGLARFRVRLPLDTRWINEPDNVKRKSLEFVQNAKATMAELVYELHDWTPDADLLFEYRRGLNAWIMSGGGEDPAPEGPAHSGLPETERCQSFSTVLSLGEDLANPHPRRKPPTDADIQAALSKGTNTRLICKNAVFALHGRKFRDDKLNKYFYGPKGFVPGQWPYDVLKPNPRYEDSLLTKGQWKAIELFERLPEK